MCHVFLSLDLNIFQSRITILLVSSRVTGIAYLHWREMALRKWRYDAGSDKLFQHHFTILVLVVIKNIFFSLFPPLLHKTAVRTHYQHSGAASPRTKLWFWELHEIQSFWRLRTEQGCWASAWLLHLQEKCPNTPSVHSPPASLTLPGQFPLAIVFINLFAKPKSSNH